MFRREARPAQQGRIVVNGIRFTWQRDGAVVTVTNSIYGRTEYAIGAESVQDDLVRHLALELLSQGPRKATELFPAIGAKSRFLS